MANKQGSWEQPYVYVLGFSHMGVFFLRINLAFDYAEYKSFLDTLWLTVRENLLKFFHFF